MKFITVLAVALLSVSAFGQSQNYLRVVKMVQADPVGMAAIAEAKAYAGVQTCTFNTVAKQVDGADPGVVDYTVHATCTAAAPNDQGVTSQAVLDFSGRMFAEDGPQDMTLTTNFGSAN